MLLIQNLMNWKKIFEKAELTIMGTRRNRIYEHSYTLKKKL